MKSSRYNIFLKKDNEFYVYNTLTTSILQLTDELVHILETSKNLNSVQKDLLDVLIHNGIIVSKDSNEVSLYEYYYNKAKYFDSQEKLIITILPTYLCNLECVYCYEGDKRITRKLNKEQISNITKFVQWQVENNKLLKELKLHFFGGEPLLCKEQCIEIANAIRELADAYNIKFFSSIATNATLIDEYIIEHLIIPNQMQMQITLDGSKNIHDKRRIYKSGIGTYDKIVQNIDLLNKFELKNNIFLRVNVDVNNLDTLTDVFAEFYKKVNVIKVAPLISTGSYSCQTEKCYTFDSYYKFVYPQITSIYKQFDIKEQNISFGKRRPCAFSSENRFFIDCKLNVYKCIGFVGNEQFAVGSINPQGQFDKNGCYSEQFVRSPFKISKCIVCKLLPLCAGGCAYRAYLDKKTFNAPFCEQSEEGLMSNIDRYLSEV